MYISQILDTHLLIVKEKSTYSSQLNMTFEFLSDYNSRIEGFAAASLDTKIFVR